MITIQDAIARVRKIDQIKGDDEAAHFEEDSLRFDILEYIATGTVEPHITRELALIACSTEQIEFSRWCA